MIHRTLRWAWDNEIGVWGWKPNWLTASNVNALTDGFGVAHDILEHRLGDRPTVEEEIIAHGAMWHIRGQHGYWADKYNPDPAYHMGSSWPEFFRSTYEAGKEVMWPGRVRPVEHWDEELVRVVKEGRRQTEGECDSNYEHCLNEFEARTLGWLRRGVRLAARRYAGCSSYAVLRLFDDIKDHVNYLKNRVRGEEGEGMLLKVSFHLPRGYAATALHVRIEEPSFSHE